MYKSVFYLILLPHERGYYGGLRSCSFIDVILKQKETILVFVNEINSDIKLNELPKNLSEFFFANLCANNLSLLIKCLSRFVADDTCLVIITSQV